MEKQLNPTRSIVDYRRSAGCASQRGGLDREVFGASSGRQTKHTTVLGGLVAIALLLAACSTSPANTTKGQSSAASTNRTLVIGSEVAPPSLDLTSNPAAAIQEVLDYNVYQHLVQFTPKGELIPVLATSWKITNSGRTYTFDIRPGVKFSNGAPLTAADVVYSMKRVVAPGSVYPHKKSLASVMQSVNAIGSKQVQVTLNAPDWGFLETLASTSDGVILDPSAVPKIATHPVGTGPFEFSNLVPNYSATLVRNPLYWGPSPKVANVTWRYFSNPTAENSALRTGEIDVIDNEPYAKLVAPFRANPKYQVISGPTPGKVDLVLNNTYGPLQNVLVRRAISYATDKRALIATAAAGPAVPLGSEAAPMNPYYLNLANVYPYDPAKARALLAQAGYPHGFSINLVLPPYNYAQVAGPLVASELKAVGINVTLSNIQWPLWLSTVFAHGNYQMTIVDFIAYNTVTNFGNPKYFFHYAGSNTVSKMIASADAQPSQAGWIKGMHGVLRLITKDAVVDWLWNQPMASVARKGIVGLPAGLASTSYQVAYASFGGTVSRSVASQGFSS